MFYQATVLMCLTVFLSAKGLSSDNPLTAIICEHHTNTISCPAETDTLDIIAANYGRTKPDAVICPYGRNHRDMTNCFYDRTDQIRSQCSDLGACSVHVTNGAMGRDPCGGTYKYLNVTYRCVSYCRDFDLLNTDSVIYDLLSCDTSITDVFETACYAEVALLSTYIEKRAKETELVNLFREAAGCLSKSKHCNKSNSKGQSKSKSSKGTKSKTNSRSNEIN